MASNFKGTRGPWKVEVHEWPFSLKASQYTHATSGTHEERVIVTEWDHPQLKGPEPVVTMSIGVGNGPDRDCYHMVHISPENAQAIAAVPDMIEALEAWEHWDYEVQSAKVNGESIYDHRDFQRMRDDAEQKMRAALTKATGGAPDDDRR